MNTPSAKRSAGSKSWTSWLEYLRPHYVINNSRTLGASNRQLKKDTIMLMKRSMMNNLSSAMAALRHSCTFAIFVFSVSRERTRCSKTSGDWSSTRKNRQILEVFKIWSIDWQADQPTEWLAKNWTSRLINLSIDRLSYWLKECELIH